MLVAAKTRFVKESITTFQVAEYLGLHPVRKGDKSWCICPFHKEKTSSMAIYPNTRGYFCFGCGRGGDAIDLYARVQNIGMKDASEELAKIFRINTNGLPKTVSPVGESYEEKRRKEIIMLDKLIREFRLVTNILSDFNKDSEIPDWFYDMVEVKSNLEMQIDVLCLCKR